ncbi:MAG: PAS domain S-box protein [Promethearchaeota archaeon]
MSRGVEDPDQKKAQEAGKGELERLREQVKRLEEELARYKRRERALQDKPRQSTTNLEDLFFDFAGVIFVVLDRQGRIARINKMGCEILGYERGEIVGKDWFQLAITEDQVGEVRSWFGKLMNGEVEPVEHTENYVVTKSGELRKIAWHNSVFRDESGRILFTISSGEDITEKEGAERSLQESEEKFRAIAEQSILGIVIISLEGEVMFANQVVADMVGYPLEEVLSWDVETAFKHLLPGNRFAFVENFYKIVNDGVDYQTEYESTRKSGERLWVRFFARKIRFRGEDMVQAIMLDITGRKEAEKKLAASEERLRSFLRNFQGVAFRCDMNLHPEFCLGSVTEITGYSDSDFLRDDLRWEDLVVPEHLEAYGKNIDKLRSIPGLSIEFEYQIKDKAGKVRWIQELARNITNDQGQIVAIDGTRYETTERKKWEEESLKAQKLESIALLAGGIAHDFNNILVGILGNVNLVQLSKNLPPDVAESLDGLEKAALQARDLTKQLLTFSRGGAPVKRPESLESLIRDSVSFVMRGRNSRCELDLPSSIPTVDVDASQIKQVLNNILINAVQAMPGGGIINIRVETTFLLKSPEFPHQAGEYVKLSIRDQGDGIPRSLRDRVFEPYFTTKEEGTGLGLATSYSIVKRHGGHISFDSVEGEGTTFHVYLPISSEEVHQSSRRPDLREFAGKALVMDDEPTVQRVLSRLLSKLGFEADMARDGMEAIALYDKKLAEGDPYAVVIMDLTIPGGMGGKEAVKHLVALDPNVKAIVSSGYSNDPIMSSYKEFGFAGVLTKPYTVRQLQKTLGKVLRVEKGGEKKMVEDFPTANKD